MLDLNKTDAVIFDLDGVIVDTAKYHYHAWEKIAGMLGFDFSYEDNECLKGVSRMKSLDILLDIGGVQEDENRKVELAELKNKLYTDYLCAITVNEILPGARELILLLKQRGRKVAVASASRNAGLILEKLSLVELFDVIVYGNCSDKAKPDPELFLIAARRLDVPPERCLVIEDAAAGIDAAISAGMAVIGVGNYERLHKADFVVKSLCELSVL